jgi:predicted PurR-regulated permease PerM
MATPTAPPNKLLPFVATICLFFVVAAMYFARVVIVPVVLAALLAFVLTPVVSALQRRKVPRVAAALLTAIVAFAFLGGVLVLVFFQFRGLAADLRKPKAQEEIQAKAKSVHYMLVRESLSDLAKVIDDAFQTINPSKGGADDDKKAAEDAAAVTAPSPPPGTPFWGPFVEWIYAPVLEVFVDAGVVIVLVVFMLSQHEDLRNRALRLSGKRNVTSATKALSDASHRVRKFLLMQFFINSLFAAVVSGGLWLIGVPYPFLWGVLGGLLRYVPYVGTWLASFCPVLLAIAVLPGWVPPILTFGLFVVLDLLITNIAEPIIYGRSVGVSGTALLIAAVFWTWLWGPVGLILSTPLTACLVVLGRYVTQMEFLSVLLGDEPPLSLPMTFYQRLLAHDDVEATTLVEEYIQKNGVEKLYDDMLLPSMVHAKLNRDRGVMTVEDEEFIITTTRELLEDVVYPAQDALDAKEVAKGGAEVKCRLLVLGCPAKDEFDELALGMMQRLLPAGKCQVELLSKDTLAGEMLARVGEAKPAALVIAAVPPYSFAAVRYLCKRMRTQFPAVKILVGCWGLRDEVKKSVDRLLMAGADLVSAELLETRNLLLPLVQEAAVAHAAEETKPAELVRA